MSGSGVMLCLGCRYSLADLPRGVCPECGREFDPGDAATFYEPRRFMLSAGWSRAPDGGHAFVASVASLTLFGAYWTAYTNLTLLYVGGAAWAALLACISTRAVLRLAPEDRHRLRVPRRKFWRRSAMVGMAALLTAFMLWFEVPLKVRYFLSYSSLRAVADELKASEHSVMDLGGHRLGWHNAVAAFKVGGGQAIEVLPPWNSIGNWGGEVVPSRPSSFADRGHRGVARISDWSVRRIDPTEGGRYHDVHLEHMWGDWYLFRWKMFGNGRQQ